MTRKLIFLLLFVFGYCFSQTSIVEYIELLDKKNIDSIGKAYSKFEDEVSKLDSIEIDQIYVSFSKMYFKIAAYYSDKVMEISYSDSSIIKYEKEVLPFGLAIYSTEGCYYIDQSPDYLYKRFVNYVSTPMKLYLKQRRHELKNYFSEDAMMLITISELTKRIEFWEDYIEKYSNALMIEDAKYFYNVYLSTFLTGLDNSWIVDHEGKLLNDYKEAYENYIEKHGNKKSGYAVREYYEAIKENSYRIPENGEEILEKHGLFSMEHVQPHLR